MSFINPATWAKYKSLMRKAHDTFNQATVTWVRGAVVLQRFNEQEEPSGNYVDLKGLINYNVFRTWPITRNENTGESDNQNMVLILNREYLSELGYLTSRGYFNFRPDLDYFIHQGIRYKAEGDTAAAQAYDDPLFIYLVLHREETLTGDAMFDSPVILPVIEEIEVETLYLVSYDLLP